jgi:hypothetical protein
MVCQEWEVLHISYTVYMSTNFLNPHFNSNDNNLTIIILLQKQTPCIIGILLFKRMEDIVLTISSSLVSLFLYVLVYVCRWYVHIHTSMFAGMSMGRLSPTMSGMGMGGIGGFGGSMPGVGDMSGGGGYLGSPSHHSFGRNL